MKKEVAISVLFVVIISLTYVVLATPGVSLTGKVVGNDISLEIEDEVINKINEEGSASVIVVLKDDGSPVQENQDEVLERVQKRRFFTSVDESDFQLRHKYSNLNSFSADINEKVLERLENDPAVEKVVINKILYPFLDNSVPQINGDDVQAMTVNDINLKGAGETICIIDTGIDTDHPAFTGRILDQHCFCQVTDDGSGGCCSDATSENGDAEDAHGHGTHVSGIAAGNDATYRGVAPEAGIVFVKVCNSVPQAACGLDDVMAGVDWCTNNASQYNVSVISISLGDGTKNNAYCNDDSLAPAINAAVDENISVVIASGNNGYSDGISAPACVENAIPMGAVNTEDGLVYNRGAVLDLVAPGTAITAPYKGGGMATMSGTSMATPHVAGAVALFRQYWRLAYDKVPSPEIIENKLYLTGKLIEEAGKNYSRIDVLRAIQPSIEFTENSFLDAGTLIVNGVLINVTSDVDLSSALLEWNYLNGTIENLTMLSAGARNFYYQLTNLTITNYTYQVYGKDSVNTLGISGERTIFVDGTAPEVVINNPISGVILGGESILLNTTVTDDGEVASVVFEIDGEGNEEPIILIAENSENYWVAELNLTTLSDGVHTLTVLANDTLDNLNDEESVSFTIDHSGPEVSLENPLNNSEDNLGLVSFSFNVSDELSDVTSCSLYLNGVVDEINSNITEEDSLNFIINLPVANYSWFVQCVDGVENVGNSETRELNIIEFRPEVSLDSPADNFISSSTEIDFTCSATEDSSLSNLTLFGDWGGNWEVKETMEVSGTSNSSTFNKVITDGVYIWNCLAVDSDSNQAFASVNRTFTIDTVVPTIDSVAVDSISEDSATITWETDENADSLVEYGVDGSVTESDSDGALVTSHSISLTDLSASTIYSYSVTSCDAANNCEVSDLFEFTTSASSDDSDDDSDDSSDDSSDDDSDDSSSSGGGSGGGGGGSNSVSPAAKSKTEKITAESMTRGLEQSQLTLASDEVDEEISSSSNNQFSERFMLMEGEPFVVTIGVSSIPVTEMRITSTIGKEANVRVNMPSEKPEELPELEGVYHYLEINVDLENDELVDAVIQFNVPQNWLAENDVDAKDIVLMTFDGTSWKKLRTKMISDGDPVVYEAVAKHFSYFAITQKKSLFNFNFDFNFGWNPKYNLIAGLVGVILILSLLGYYLAFAGRD